MQLSLIFAILFAILAVLFSLQNITPVTVSLATWQFEGSLALVLLIAVAFGALIAALLTTPAMLRAQWSKGRHNRQLAALQAKLAEQEKRNAVLAAEIETLRATATGTAAPTPAAEEKPYVGLRSLLTGGGQGSKRDA